MLAPSPPIDRRVSRTPAQGFVTGGARMLLRLEGFATFAAAVAFYAMLAYLAGPRAGAIAYNLAHTYALALALTLAGFLGGVPAAAASGLIWIAHIGFDRALGYGLKYSSGFGDTHLGRIGRR